MSEADSLIDVIEAAIGAYRRQFPRPQVRDDVGGGGRVSDDTPSETARVVERLRAGSVDEFKATIEAFGVSGPVVDAYVAAHQESLRLVPRCVAVIGCPTLPAVSLALVFPGRRSNVPELDLESVCRDHFGADEIADLVAQVAQPTVSAKLVSAKLATWIPVEILLGAS